MARVEEYAIKRTATANYKHLWRCGGPVVLPVGLARLTEKHWKKRGSGERMGVLHRDGRRLPWYHGAWLSAPYLDGRYFKTYPEKSTHQRERERERERERASTLGKVVQGDNAEKETSFYYGLLRCLLRFDMYFHFWKHCVFFT